MVGENNNRGGRGRFVTICILVSVIVVLALNGFCIFCACCPGVISNLLGGAEVIEPEAIQEAAEGGLEAALINTGLSMIGIAISVWAALNITNALERKEIDGIYDEMDALQEKNEKKLSDFTEAQEKALRNLKDEYQKDAETFNALKDQQEADFRYIQQVNGYNQFLLEILKSKKDLATEVIYETMMRLKVLDGIPFDHLIRLEQYFGQVYQLHESGNKKSASPGGPGRYRVGQYVLRQ